MEKIVHHWGCRIVAGASLTPGPKIQIEYEVIPETEEAIRIYGEFWSPKPAHSTKATLDIDPRPGVNPLAEAARDRG